MPNTWLSRRCNGPSNSANEPLKSQKAIPVFVERIELLIKQALDPHRTAQKVVEEKPLPSTAGNDEVIAEDSSKATVLLKQGVYAGEDLVSSTGCPYSSYKGIPYARPPVGNLRFKAPAPIQKFLGANKATEHGPICVQYLNDTSDDVVGSEDCLYLNVYAPKPRDSLNSVRLPVMFYIHGGFFITGSGNSYELGPDFLMCYDVILVTINYRLGPLGFLSVDTRDVSGNTGLKDQLAALKWVKANIGVFGGDPEKVTIMGQSAGASSVNLHMLSPRSTGLFIRAIAMSSSLFSDYSTSYQHVNRSFTLGERLGCNTTNTNTLIQCLRNRTAEDLFKAKPNILPLDGISTQLHFINYFTPIVEKQFNNQQFLTEHPQTLLSKGAVNKVEFMTGHTANEGLGLTSFFISDILKYFPSNKELYVPAKISNIRNPQLVSKLADEIRSRYITNGTISASIKGLTNQQSYFRFVYYIHYFNDRYFNATNKNQYFYQFVTYTERNVDGKRGAAKLGIEEATHKDDLGYLFSGKKYGNTTITKSSPIYKYIDKMCTYYTNFIKYGKPTLDNSWPAYGNNKNFVTINNDTLTVNKVVYRGQLGFWQKIFDEAGVVPYIN